MEIPAGNRFIGEIFFKKWQEFNQDCTDTSYGQGVAVITDLSRMQRTYVNAAGKLTDIVLSTHRS